MMKQILLLLALVLVAAAHFSWTSDLIAGKHHIAGTVKVEGDDDNSVVTTTYETTDGWCLTETNLLLTKTPPTVLSSAPESFTKTETHSCVTMFVYTCNFDDIFFHVKSGVSNIEVPPSGFDVERDTLYVAAHASVLRDGEKEVCVDAEVEIPPQFIEDVTKCPCVENTKEVCMSESDHPGASKRDQICFEESCVTDPPTDQWSQWPGDFHSLLINGLGEDFNSVNAKFGENEPNGLAYVSGDFVSKSDASMKFEAEIYFWERTETSLNPMLQLDPSAYAPLGPVDPATWHYYHKGSGTLKGSGSLAGLILGVELIGKPFQVGDGASGRNADHGGSSWLRLTVLQADNKNKYSEGQSFLSDILFNTCCFVCTGECINVPLSDEFSRWPADNLVFWDPVLGTDFVPDPSVGVYWMQKPGGAELFGTVKSLSDPNKILKLEFTFSNYQENVPAAMRLLQLLPNAYVPFGTVDPEDWVHYLTLTGTVTGAGSLSGLVFDAAIFEKTLQVGVGASGRNIRPGLAAWLMLSVRERPNKGPYSYLEITESSDIIAEFCCLETVVDQVETAWGAGPPFDAYSEAMYMTEASSNNQAVDNGVLDDVVPVEAAAGQLVVGLLLGLSFVVMIWL